MIKRLSVIAVLLVATGSSFAGGPLYVGGTFGIDGQPFLWDISSGPIQYRTDGGPMARTGSTTVVDNAAGITRVQSMFNAWQNVPTSDIAFTRAGNLLPQGAFTDGDVSTVAEFNALEGRCNQP